MYAGADGTRFYSLKYSALRLPSLLPFTAGFTGFTAVFFTGCLKIYDEFISSFSRSKKTIYVVLLSSMRTLKAKCHLFIDFF